MDKLFCDYEEEPATEEGEPKPARECGEGSGTQDVAELVKQLRVAHETDAGPF